VAGTEDCEGARDIAAELGSGAGVAIGVCAGLASLDAATTAGAVVAGLGAGASSTIVAGTVELTLLDCAFAGEGALSLTLVDADVADSLAPERSVRGVASVLAEEGGFPAAAFLTIFSSADTFPSPLKVENTQSITSSE
jgi:hypothetical protein